MLLVLEKNNQETERKIQSNSLITRLNIYYNVVVNSEELIGTTERLTV